MTVNINLLKDLPQGATVVEAFPSRGYVSTIAANHLIRQLKMEQVGYIECDKLDAIAVVHDGKPMHPIRIYQKDNLVVFFSELIIPFNMVHEFTTGVADLLAGLKPKSMLLLASIPGVESKSEHEILAVSTDPEMAGKLAKLKVKRMEEGVLTGMSSSLMMKCVALNIPSTSLLIETAYMPDVLASASLLRILSDLLGVNVDVDELVKTGKQIEDKFRDNFEQIKIGHENLQEMHHQLPMYR
ncbi:MAG: PAC2 family protein [Candidatus Altiarchaeota archaeon]